MNITSSTQPRSIPTSHKLRRWTSVTCTASPNGKTPPNGDSWATKYCFCARSIIRTSSEGPKESIGIIFGYDRTPSISTQVDSVSKAFMDQTGYDVDDVELLLHEECPVELSDHIYVQFFDNAPLHGFDEDMFT